MKRCIKVHIDFKRPYHSIRLLITFPPLISCVYHSVPFLICQRQKPLESIVPNYQDTEDPDYDDFRAEASLQRSRQLESFSKAAEAFKQGRKEVASFYAQQVRS